MAEGFKIEGLKQLDRALAEMSKGLGFKALRSGMMAASRPMFLAAKANASATGVKGFDSGATAAAMGRWVRKIKPTVTLLQIGPKNKLKKAVAIWNAAHGTNISRLNHFHLVEFGSVHGPAQPFMRPAFESTKSIVASIFARELKKAIEKVRAKAARGT